MRISGLIRAFNRIRAQLQAGIPAGDVAQFRTRVQSLLLQVEQICAEGWITPADLPAPSRRAYLFLRQLDLANLPLRREEQPAPAPVGLRLRRVSGLADQLADRLWRQLAAHTASAGALAELRQYIQRIVSLIEDICAQHNVTPAQLDDSSRQGYGWWKFLLSEDNLGLHVAALQRAHRVLSQHHPPPPWPVHVHLMRIGPLWRRRAYSDLILLKVHEGFLNADDGVWQSIVSNALSGPDPEGRACVRAYAESEDFAEVVVAMDAFAEPGAPAPQGYAHNLAESFERVNAAYFDSAMPRPKLVWNRTLTGRKFGHYQTSTDTVMLSVSLDSPTVPDTVVDYVMYHELLHKRHGTIQVDGRRLAHTPAFRAEERRFLHFAQAEQHLKRLARGR